MTFLLFDAYGTLVELDDFYGRLQQGFTAEGTDVPREVVKRASHREMHHYIAHSLRARDEESREVLRHECAAVLAEALRDDGFSFTHEIAYRVLSQAIVFRVFPETRAVLEELRLRGIPMGVLSNWDCGLHNELRKLGLNDFFEFVISSSQFGYEKPDARFFAHGLQKIAERHPVLSPRECFYIGDHYDKDVVPARAAGMNALWLVRDQRDLASGDIHAADDITPLRSLSEVMHVIDNLQNTRLTQAGAS